MNMVGVLQNEKIKRFIQSLKYSLYVIVHPFDGFWDLTHEKRGSLGAANFIVIMYLVTHILKMQYTSFLFYLVDWEYVNMVMEVLSLLAPIFIWTISNWSLTTLMNGKGNLRQIYIGTAYAFTPQILIGLPLIPLSNLVTVEEGVFYTYLSSFSTVWTGFLVLCAMMMIHDYSLGKAVFSSLLTIIGMGVIIFILLLFFSLVSDGVGYFVSMYKEIAFRFY